MSDAHGTLEVIARHLVLAVQPLRDGLADLDAFKGLMYRLGWEVESVPPGFASLGALVEDALLALKAMDAAPGEVEPSQVLALLGKARAVYRGIVDLTDAPAGADPATFLPEIRERLFELLLVDYMAIAVPPLYEGLVTLGIITVEPEGESGDRPPYVRTRIRYDRVRNLIADPMSLPRIAYGWGEDDLDTATLFGNLREILEYTGGLVSFGHAPDDLVEAYMGAGAPRSSIKLTVLETSVAGEPVEVAFVLLPLPPEGEHEPGLIVQPVVPPDLELDRRISAALRLRIRPNTDLSDLFGIVIRPGELSVRYPFTPGGALPAVGFGIAVEYRPVATTLLFGRPFATRLEMRGATASLDLDHRAGALELRLGLELEGLVLALATREQDSFLATLIGAEAVAVPIPLTIQWSSRTGVTLAGGAGFEVSCTTSLAVGPLSVHQLHVVVRTTLTSGAPPDLIAEAGVSIGGRIGPIALSAEKVGLRLTAVFQDGNAGPFDIAIGFKPPSGIGISIDAGPIAGGGFLDYDDATGRYSGALELEVHDIGVKAIGLLDTRMPGGSPAYSFLIIITTEFTPIQLGFGFTLNGVGGLAGIHRRLESEALRTRLREGSLDHILFAEDPVRDAPLIVSDLQAVFPPAADRYVFGPMALIGWGTPALLEGELGILLELPDPARIVVLAQVHAALPRKEKAIVELNLDVLGEIDVERQRFALDGRLYDSRVVSFPIEGDMAMRLQGGESPNFALAIGGFHPAYTPPPGFPRLRRVTVAIGLDDDPRITLEGYLALTSNTLQVGAAAAVYAEAGWFNITGEIRFNALFTFSPFSFVTDFSGAVALRKGSTDLAAIRLEAILSGPTPWHAAGKACLEIRWLPDICVGFDATFGREERVELPRLDPWPLLRDAVQNPESWSGARPPGVFRGATVGTAAAAAGGVLLDPALGVTLRQTVVPLHRRITRFGAAQPEGGPTRFDIQRVRAGGSDMPDWTGVDDFFAPAQFEDLTDDEKLTRPSFERMDAGLTFARDDVAHGGGVGTAVEYETRIIDSAFETRRVAPYFPARVLQVAVASRGAAGRSPLGNSGRSKFAPPATQPPLARLDAERFVVASTVDLAARPDVTPPAGKGAAFQALAAYLAAHPDEQGQLEVVSLDELAVEV